MKWDKTYPGPTQHQLNQNLWGWSHNLWFKCTFKADNIFFWERHNYKISPGNFINLKIKNLILEKYLDHA